MPTTERSVPLTRRAHQHESGLYLMPYEAIIGCVVTHTLPLPAMCPISGNPAAGSTITITYTPHEWTLEVVALRDYLASFVGGRERRGIRIVSMEQVPEVVAADTADALWVDVDVVADLVINPDQRMVVRA